MNTDHPLAATLAQIHRLSLDAALERAARAEPVAWLYTYPHDGEQDHCLSLSRFLPSWVEAKGATETPLYALAALPGGGVDDYEAKYATAERLARPAATEHRDFCGARPSDLHAYDCTALDEERQSQLLLPDEKLFAGAARDHHHGYVSGWNECLHRVVAMNQRGGK